MDNLIQDIYLNIGRNIYKYRKQRDMTALDLGKRIGVTLKTMRRYELGEIKISSEKISQIADILQVEISELASDLDTKIAVEDLVDMDLTFQGLPLDKEKKQQAIELLSKILGMTQ
jgi:transcriptional regulator with XRE-family HTH domain